MSSDQSVDRAWEYARSYFKDDPEVESDFNALVECLPAVFANYMEMRKSLFREPPEGALARKYKELVILGIEISNRKTNPPPTRHARKALEAGASVEEIAEVVGLCIMLGGMITYRESGRFVLHEVMKT